MAKNFEKAFTFFMMPFYIKGGQPFIFDQNSDWERLKMNIDKGILYSHIQEFISKSVMEDKKTGKLPSDQELATHDFHIYSLSQKSDRFKGMMDYDTEHAIIEKRTVGGKKVSQSITFRFNNSEKDLSSFFSPKLIICPNAQVGVLLFSIEMTGNKDLESLSKLNYALFKTFKEDSSQSSHIYLLHQVKMIKQEEEIDILRKNINKRILSIRKLTERLKYPKSENAKTNDENLILQNRETLRKEYNEYKRENEQFILTCKEKLQKKESFTNQIDSINRALERNTHNKGYNIRDLLDYYWSMRQLTDSLMSNFNGKYIRADEFRLHVFTYLQVNKETGQDPDLLSDFSRIIHCQDQDYFTLPISYGQNVYEQLFENVYVGSSVEGGGVLTILKGSGDDFMKNFDSGPLVHSYLWVYLLVIMQRHTLLQMSRELAEEYGYSGDDLDSRLLHLRELTRKMSKTKINTYFTDVSDHSHLNALYLFCCINLSINRYFVDVDNKLATLKETLEQLHDEKMVELEQRQKQEQEKQTKIQQKRLFLEKEHDRRQQNVTKWIGVVAVILTLFSALSDSYDLFGKDKLNWIPDSLSSLCHLLLLFGAFSIVGTITWKIIEEVQEGNNQHNNDIYFTSKEK